MTPPSPAAGMRRPLRRWAVALLIVFGVQLWLVIGKSGGIEHRVQLWCLGGAVLLWLIPPIRRGLWKLMLRLRRPRPRTAALAAVGFSVAVAVYLLWTARHFHHYFAPVIQDEFSYLLQARMLLHGRLWMPEHPLADFFESFYVIVQPVYASMYFPGTALFLAPLMGLGLPPWLASLMTCAASAGILYLVITELIDGVAGIVSVFLLVAMSRFRIVSVLMLSHGPFLFLSLLLIWLWLRWRRAACRWPWALALGLTAGWSGITRPLDAVAFIVPVGVAMVLNIFGTTGPGTARLFRQPDGAGPSPARGFLFTSATVLLGAAPFLALQLVFNFGVTGRLLTTPFRLYADRDMPGTTLGFEPFDPDRRPASHLPQKQILYQGWADTYLRDRSFASLMSERSNRMTTDGLPSALLLLLIPAAATALDRRRLVLCATLPLFLACYWFYPLFLRNYVVTAIPAMICTVLLGIRAVELAWPGRWAGPLAVLLVLAASVSALPQVDRQANEELVPAATMTADAQLAAIDHRPAVVLFRFSRGSAPQEEPVYNIDVPWPDDAAVIRAQDLGRANVRIFAYYPTRFFYLYDRGARRLSPLGLGQDLLPLTPGAR